MSDSPIPDASHADAGQPPAPTNEPPIAPGAPARALLARKLARIMGEVRHIPKNGWNDHFKYAFATEADVSAALQQRFAEERLAVLPEIISTRRDGKLTFIDMRFTILDGDTGEGVLLQWSGNGEDNGDKALWKAITGGVKYWLLKTMLVPTGDDPEATDAEGNPTNRRARRAGRPAAPQARQAPPDNDTRRPTDGNRISAAEAERLRGLMRTHGVRTGEFVTALRSHFGYTRAEHIERRHYDAICRSIVEGIGLAVVAAELRQQQP